MNNTSKKYQIKQIVLTKENNPNVWTEDKLNEITNNKVIIGYMLKLTSSNSILNIYVLSKEYTVNKGISLEELKNAYSTWLYNVVYNNKDVLFKNPPIENWLDTKEQWIKKTANKLSKIFDKPFEEMISHVYYAIIKVYNNGKAYIGNLGYIERAAYNEVLLEIRNNRNKLLIDDYKVISIDSLIPNNDEDLTYNDVLSTEDDLQENFNFEETLTKIKQTLKFTFSEREIDQIINCQGQLPFNLYRRLLNWRKTHKRGDFNV